MFKEFKSTFQQNVALLLVGHTTLFTTDVDPQKMWDTYIGAYPEEIRQMSNCNCCRQFIKHYGNVVTIVNNKVKSIWDFTTEGHYGDIVKAMNKLVTSAKVKEVFVHKFQKLGSDTSIQRLEDGTTTRWDHLFVLLPKSFVENRNLSEEAIMGSYRDSKNVFKRSLDEITIDAVETVLELIAQNSIYRGAEFKGQIEAFLRCQKEYSLVVGDAEKDNYCWKNGTSAQAAAVSRIRNTAIGTVLVDVSDGVDLDEAVRKFERVMAPSNYKRPTAVFTSKMIAEAEKTLGELGLTHALSRRFANSDDVRIGDIMFVNRESKASGIFAEMQADVPFNPKTLSKVETVTLDDFLTKILPTSTSVEILLENKHEPNLVSLIAPSNAIDSASMFKWKNNFSWSYNNALADSMKENVKAAGGKVDGILRFSIQWNDKGDNRIDFDAHAVEPNRNEISFSNCRHPSSSSLGGNLDVDIVSPGSGSAVENITWPTKSRLAKGDYRFFVHNYSSMRSSGGFTAEIEFEGEVHSFEYGANLTGNQRIEVATVTFDGTNFSIKCDLPSSSVVNSKEMWGIGTNRFHKVKMAMQSPNHWEGEGIGNKHVFFVLEGANNTGSVRGFFNEFLKQDLDQHRKVFEALASKAKVEYSSNQLSGLGFSSTTNGVREFVVKVTGKFTRTIKVTV